MDWAGLFISVCLFIGVLESRLVTRRDYYLGLLPNHGIDSGGDRVANDLSLLHLGPCSRCLLQSLTDPWHATA